MDKHVLYILNAAVSWCIFIFVSVLGCMILNMECSVSSVVDDVEEVEIQKNEEVQETYTTPLVIAYVEEIALSANFENIETTKVTYLEISDDDLYLVSQIVNLEAGGESVECQEAVASVILNRMVAHEQSAEEVIFAENQFTTSSKIDRSYPSDELIELVRKVFSEGPTIPAYVTFFRADRYHQWSKVAPYVQIDNTYFSYDVLLKENYESTAGEQQ